jgi:hypothetical protein
MHTPPSDSRDAIAIKRQALQSYPSCTAIDRRHINARTILFRPEFSIPATHILHVEFSLVHEEVQNTARHTSEKKVGKCKRIAADGIKERIQPPISREVEAQLHNHP